MVGFIGSTLSFGSETDGSKEPLGPNTSSFQNSSTIFPAIADEQCTPGFALFF
jgi:hypothetical protein